ncbi:DUF423 domain-containing protein [Salinicola aestuarinus]|uniref:DUF423 domain-containing protein n=1 Tax=Salinicola aestuarinus TaxID=1949082 RepID=UPI000DA1A526|nr:DUF423 domain-containing protein [Salinicola aestuarinus]
MHRRWRETQISGLALAVSGLMVVAAGAFGAHALSGRVSPASLEVFQTGVRYQAWHTLAALGVFAWRQQRALRGQLVTLAFWFAGMVLFSGSLYALTFGAPRLLGVVTPVGGLCLMVGWVMLGVSAWRQRPAAQAAPPDA